MHGDVEGMSGGNGRSVEDTGIIKGRSGDRSGVNGLTGGREWLRLVRVIVMMACHWVSGGSRSSLRTGQMSDQTRGSRVTRNWLNQSRIGIGVGMTRVLGNIGALCSDIYWLVSFGLSYGLPRIGVDLGRRNWRRH